MIWKWNLKHIREVGRSRCMCRHSTWNNKKWYAICLEWKTQVGEMPFMAVDEEKFACYFDMAIIIGIWKKIAN